MLTIRELYDAFEIVIYRIVTFLKSYRNCIVTWDLRFSFEIVTPGQYLKEMCHPDLLVINLGSNGLTCVHSTVAEVADDALRLLALLDDDVHPKMIILLSVIQRTSVGDRGGMTMSTSTFNRRAKAFNSRIAVCVRQIANVRMFAQSRINFPRYICHDGCHLTEEGQARYIKGLRQAVLKLLALC